ncbi:GNAT family N-acetyltransferase [Micromonospora tulbaghiae]|uniref:GNAT family N-acetyltransferase n=1 Tax=Micromonospora tulbaghiae TaxID=479978 RepID=UPI0033EB0E19
MPTQTIRRATEADAVDLLPVFVEGFLDGPIADWLIEDRDERRIIYQRYFRLMLRQGLANGWVDTTAGLNGAAIWYRRPAAAAGPPPGYQDDMAYATGRHLARFRLIDAMFEEHRPRIEHIYLAFIAVAPGHQGKGVGTALLAHAHAELDEVGLPAYLEASNADNMRLYKRLGWEASPRLFLPKAGPPFWRMWRSQPDPTAADVTP